MDLYRIVDANDMPCDKSGYPSDHVFLNPKSARTGIRHLNKRDAQHWNKQGAQPFRPQVCAPIWKEVTTP
jgi:ribosomal protein S16